MSEVAGVTVSQKNSSPLPQEPAPNPLCKFQAGKPRLKPQTLNLNVEILHPNSTLNSEISDPNLAGLDNLACMGKSVQGVAKLPDRLVAVSFGIKVSAH